MEQAQQGGFGLKTLSSVYVGSRIFPAWTDCWVSPWCCGINRNKAQMMWGVVCLVLLRSAFRPAPSVDIPAWIVADYYHSRSEHYARRFGLSLSESGEGWSRVICWGLWMWMRCKVCLLVMVRL